MTWIATLMTLLPPADPAPPPGDLLAIRVGRAETVSQGPIDHAVILVENGKIVAIGQDLPIERGIPVLDRPEWTAMPGLVDAYSRLGMDSRAGSIFEPQLSSEKELFPPSPDYRDVLEAGVTTLGQYPAGMGIPGRAIAVRPSGATRAEMLLAPSAYLKVYFRSDSRSKKMVKEAFEKLDEHLEKVKKAREKWEKDQEKKKKPPDKKEEKKEDEKKPDEKKPDDKPEEKKPDAPDDKKASDKKDEKKEDAFVPPEPDEKVKPFLDLHEKKARALVSIGQSGDWLHWLDAIGERDFPWDLRVPMVRELDLYEVKEALGKRGVRVVMEPQLTLHPSTVRQRNLAMELAQAGAKIVFVPRTDSVQDCREWLRHAGEIVAAGLDRQVALRALTLEPATLLGLEERLGSLDKGKDANLLFAGGDPLEAGTRLQAVMLEGRFVYGEVKQ